MGKKEVNEVNKLILSLDVGKNETKVEGRNIEGTATDIKRISFGTKLYNLENGYIDIEGNSHKVKFEGKEYIVGEQGDSKSYDTSKTNMLHKIAAYTAIVQYLEANTKNNEVYLVLACPLSVLKIQKLKEEYKSFIKGEGVIKITVDDKKYEFEIKEITIKAEGSGILYLEKDRFKEKIVSVIDLGGLNLGFSLYINGVCKNEDRFIEEWGSNALIELVREELVKYKNGNLVSYNQAELALDKGYLPKAGEADMQSVKAINTAKERYFDKAMEYIKSHGYNIEELDEVIFVGGTPQNIKTVISSKLNHSYIPSDSQWCTCDGGYKIAIKKYGK